MKPKHMYHPTRLDETHSMIHRHSMPGENKVCNVPLSKVRYEGKFNQATIRPWNGLWEVCRTYERSKDEATVRWRQLEISNIPEECM